jgi:hypothetical protein
MMPHHDAMKSPQSCQFRVTAFHEAQSTKGSALQLDVIESYGIESRSCEVEPFNLSRMWNFSPEEYPALSAEHLHRWIREICMQNLLTSKRRLIFRSWPLPLICRSSYRVMYHVCSVWKELEQYECQRCTVNVQLDTVVF